MDYLVVITGGGTGGHVFPGLAVAEELTKRYGAAVVWIGSRTGIERRLVEQNGVPYRWVFAGKLRRYLSLYNVLDALRVPAGVVLAIVRLRRLRPAVVFSKGGYVAVPVVIAAAALGIPIVAHESDLDPGLATRITARFARRVLVAYNESVEHYAPAVRDRVLVTGNPVRAAISAGDAVRGRAYLRLTGERPVVLFVGGSLGSVQINTLVAAVLPGLLESCDVVHQTGEGGPVVGRHAGKRGCYISQRFFAAEFPDVLAAADLVVSRAGAGAIWENVAARKAAVLIPMGTTGSRGDQLRNAELCRRRGIAEMLPPREATPERLLQLILPLVEDSQKRARLVRNAEQCFPANAAGHIAELVHEQATCVDSLGSV